MLLFPFLVRMIMIQKLGIEYLGIGSLFTSILGALSLADLGFASAAVYFLYEPVAKGKVDEVNALLAFYRKVFKIIGLIILAGGLILMPFLRYLISGSCPEDVNIYVAYLIQLASTVVSYFFFAYKSVVLIANMRNDVESIIYTAARAVMYTSQIVLLLLFRNYYAYAIAMPIFAIVRNLVRCIACNKLFPQYKCSGEVSKQTKKEIRIRITALFGHKFNTKVIQTADSVVISSFLGLSVLGVYSNYFYIFTAVSVVVSLVNDALRPIVGNYMVCEDGNSNLKVFHNFLFIYSGLITFCCTSFVCLFQNFITLWVGDYLLEFSSVILLAFYFWIAQICEAFMVYRDAAGLWHKVKYYPYVSAVVNVALNIILVQLIGINGIIISTIVTLGLISLPCETRSLFTNYFKCSAVPTLLLLLKYTLVMIATAALTFCVTQFLIGGQGILFLILKAVACCVIPVGVYCLLFRKTSEYAFFKSYLSGRRHRATEKDN